MHPIEESDLRRDGVSQDERQQPALQPDYAPVDERTIRDLLIFAKAYAKDLNFVDVEGNQLEIIEQWEKFFADIDLDEAIAYLQSPEKFSAEIARRYTRPHFALFLTFLELLQHTRNHLNGFTKRHLDYFYTNVLRLTKRGSIPDRVNVLVELATGSQQYELPAGTLLDAGVDNLGQNLVYRTEQSITVNQAQIAKLKTLFVDKKAIGLRQIWEKSDLPTEEAVIKMLELALGHPLSGDPMPLYPLVPNPLNITVDAERKAIDYSDRNITELEDLYAVIDFVPLQLFLDFDQYRNLIERKAKLEALSNNWQVINDILAKAWKAKVRATNIAYDFEIENEKDFEQNLKHALNLTEDEYDDLFDGIPSVVTLTDAYSRLKDALVRSKINSKLFLPVDEDDNEAGDGLTFEIMMQSLIPIESNWETILTILQQARTNKYNSGLRFKLRGSTLPSIPLKDIVDFNDALKIALDITTIAIPYPASFVGAKITDLTAYNQHLRTLEDFFFMPAEDFHYFMSTVINFTGGGEADGNRKATSEWELIFSILDKSHKEKVYADRRKELQAVREDADGGFDAMLYLALDVDESKSSVSPIDLLGQYNVGDDRIQFLREMKDKEATIENIDKRWQDVYTLVEQIQRTVLPEPIPQTETWRNLYPNEDAKSVKVKSENDVESISNRWQTFGQSADIASSKPSFGWAISSPILNLSEGNRTITLTLGFDPDAFLTDELADMFESSDTIPFAIDISTEKGWTPVTLDIKEGTNSIGDYKELIQQREGEQEEKPLAGIQFKLAFGQDIDPLSILPSEDNPFDSVYPILRLLMKPVLIDKTGTDEEAVPYLSYKELILRRVHLAIHVTELQPSHIQNDRSVLKPGKPFEPFGFQPSVGSRFYLTHHELADKKLDNLTVHIDWMDVPSKLVAHYNNYKESASAVSSNSDFTTKISLIDHGLELSLNGGSSALFIKDDATQHRAIPLSNISDKIKGRVYDRLLTYETDNEVTSWDRYIQLELNSPDFQHSTYPRRASALAIALAAESAKANPEIKVTDYQINPPYTPKIKTLTLEYNSSLEIEVANYETGAEVDQLFHIHPFGYYEFQPDPIIEGHQFLPQFDNEGELFIGIENLGVARTLSLLFQMAEGSADPDLPVETVHWHYLTGNQWKSLQNGQLLEDGTRGLINSGIVRFKLDDIAPNTLLDPDLYWIRASIQGNSNSVCDAIDIHTQAVVAQFMNQNNAPDHLRQPLPPETITKLAKAKAQVNAIHQPYSSYGGKTSEQDETFYTRISERLRHKNRAVTSWDYEHLILDRFPEIYKVKCLPATPDRPGEITVVVIPDIRNQNLFDPFEPKAPANVIADIEAYLADRMPAHASVTVKNAHYVPVKLRFAVRFVGGTDEAYAKKQLITDLNRFLSPWAYNITEDIVIGGRIYANVIINFIEEQPYIDFVAEIRLFKQEKGQDFELVKWDKYGYWVEPDSPDGVLVAAHEHEIDIISEAGYFVDSFKGINYMRVELDFIVRAD